MKEGERFSLLLLNLICNPRFLVESATINLFTVFPAETLIETFVIKKDDFVPRSFSRCQAKLICFLLFLPKMVQDEDGNPIDLRDPRHPFYPQFSTALVKHRTAELRERRYLEEGGLPGDLITPRTDNWIAIRNGLGEHLVNTNETYTVPYESFVEAQTDDPKDFIEGYLGQNE